MSRNLMYSNFCHVLSSKVVKKSDKTQRAVPDAEINCYLCEALRLQISEAGDGPGNAERNDSPETERWRPASERKTKSHTLT